MSSGNEPATYYVDAVVRNPRLCTECGKVHAFPVPRFSSGQRVRLISDKGFHHRHRVGEVTRIVAVHALLTMPCDKVEYITEFGSGAVLEDNLEAVEL